MSVDWRAIRAEYPALQNWTYLNTATYGQLSRRSLARVKAHFERRDEGACGDFLLWHDDMDDIRKLVARLVNCEPSDIAFIQNTSTGLAWLIAGLEWRAGDRVVTLEDEFPNNLYAPSVLGDRGVEFVETPWENFYNAIDERTRLVAISTANYVTGFRPPLEEIGRFLRERGVLFFLDGTQSVGAIRIDVQKARPDMLAVHGYKWLNSPDGGGFMYVGPELRKRLKPTVVGWRSHHDWRNVDQLHHGIPEFSPDAEKYEGGMLPFSVLYGMAASIEFVLEIGPDVIERRVLELADHVRDAGRRLGGEPVSTNSAIVPLRFEGRDASGLAKALAQHRVLVAARHGFVRVSPHFYNDESDIERFEATLRKLL